MSREQVVNEADWWWIQENVIPKFPKMETHLEIFELPSGKELHLWCDGVWNLIDKKEVGDE